MGHELFLKWLILWCVAVGVVVMAGWKKHAVTVGLPIAYLFDITMSHFFGGWIYSLPWYQPSDPLVTFQGNIVHVWLGFVQSVYGVVAFTFGVLTAPFLFRMIGLRLFSKTTVSPNPKLPFVYLVTGLIFNFIIGPGLSRIPSVAAVVSSSWLLVMVAVCLLLWKALGQRNIRGIVLWIIFAVFILPYITVVGRGFLGHGMRALAVIFSFLVCFYRPKWQLVAGALLSIYLGLSLYVNYMTARTEIRSVVWGEKSNLSRKTEAVLKVFSNFQFFNWRNTRHLEIIDMRLNQNVLVGRAIEYLDQGEKPFAKGQTLYEMCLAMIPRILWPDKPVKAGSGNLVSQYTGMEFDANTSVGIGQVMEFYINFGTPCVIIGFFILGVLVRLFDLKAADALYRGNWFGFTFWYLPGLGFVQSGGSLVEVSATILSSFVFCFLINKLILPRFSSRKRRFPFDAVQGTKPAT